MPRPALVWFGFFTGDPFRSGCRTTPTCTHHPERATRQPSQSPNIPLLYGYVCKVLSRDTLQAALRQDWAYTFRSYRLLPSARGLGTPCPPWLEPAVSFRVDSAWKLKRSTTPRVRGVWTECYYNAVR